MGHDYYWGAVMTRLAARLLLPTLTALVLTGALPGAVAAWTSNCGSGSSNNRVCIWKEANFDLPRAGQNWSNQLYEGKYDNSETKINDSASSLANYYSYSDIIWHWEANNQGFALCVPAGSAYSYVGDFHNDKFSSHAVTSNAC